MVTNENYEEYMMLYVDGELTPEEEQALEAYVNEHPELQQELKAYMSTQLVPDMQQAYPDKDTLMKKPNRRIFFLSPGVYYGATAAAILLIIFISLMKWNTQPANEHSIATTANEKTKTIEPRDTGISQSVRQQQTTIAYHEKEKKSQPVVTKHNPKRSSIKTPVNIIEQAGVNETQKAVAKLNIQQPELNDNTTPQKLQSIIVSQKTTAIASSNAVKPDKDLLALLPLSEEKKDGIEALQQAITNRIKQVKSIKNNLSETAFVVKLGNKKLVLNF